METKENASIETSKGLRSDAWKFRSSGPDTVLSPRAFRVYIFRVDNHLSALYPCIEYCATLSQCPKTRTDQLTSRRQAAKKQSQVFWLLLVVAVEIHRHEKQMITLNNFNQRYRRHRKMHPTPMRVLGRSIPHIQRLQRKRTTR
jgi:hypothetical protein